MRFHLAAFGDYRKRLCYSYVAEKGSFQVTVSYGLADVSGAKDFLAAMHLADAKMYASKYKRLHYFVWVEKPSAN